MMNGFAMRITLHRLVLSFYLFMVSGFSCAGSWEKWEDPLKDVDLDEVNAKDASVRQQLGEVSKRAKKPFLSSKAITNQIEFLSWSLGSVVATNDKCARIIYNDVPFETILHSSLDGNYFSFNLIRQRLSPQSNRLYGIELEYRDYDLSGPLGRYANGRQFLDEGRAILQDLQKRFAVPLQDLQLAAPVWPYRPGQKKSRVWGGPIPESYLCDETLWVTSRHADAWSTTFAGNLIVSLNLSLTYYDEFKIRLLIMDKAERDSSDKEFMKEYSHKHPESDQHRWIKLSREDELKPL